MIDLAEAQARLLARASVGAHERVAIEDAVGRVLAEDVVSSVALPPFTYSSMDGYALELATSSSTRRLVGESRAGGGLPKRLAVGTAMRILTGAPLPEGADAVVMQEQTSLDAGDATMLSIAQLPRNGENVRRAGEDLARGAIALTKGTRIRPTHLPILCAIGRARVTVVRRPIVSILATGDELREPGEVGDGSSIPESNAPAIAAMVVAAGGIARRLPIARDDESALHAAIAAALDGTDVLLTIGGVSVGDHDRVRPVLEALGVAIDFWRVSIKPGKPIALGRRGDAHVLGLPGNPVSALVTFALFGAPLIRALSGDASPLPPTTPVRMSRGCKHVAGRTELLRVTLSRGADGALEATPVDSQSSGSVVSIARADALAIVPKDVEGVAAGETLDAVVL